jgi:thiamine pyrophosphate-dependent acetolactate synthase large subunit-like protein
VHIEFPEDLLMQKGELRARRCGLGHVPPGGRAPADPEMVRQAAEMLVEAKLPLIHCGGAPSARAQAPGCGRWLSTWAAR